MKPIHNRGDSLPLQKGEGRCRTDLLTCLWGTLLVVVAWRVYLAGDILLYATGQSALAVGLGGLVHWRHVDQLWAWVVLLLLSMGAEGGLWSAVPLSVGQSRRSRIVTVITAIGILLLVAAIAADEWGSDAAGTWLSVLADAWIILRGLLLVIRELRLLAADLRTGRLTILQLWRLASIQWLVAWLGTLLALHISMKPEDLLGTERARQLLFALPMLGLLPNVLMEVGLRWWSAIAFASSPDQPQKARTRAWLVAVIAGNVGGILLIARPDWLGIPGAACLLFACAMYLVGFPAAAWQWPGGKIVLLAWAAVAASIAMLLAERVLGLSTPPFTMTYWAGAWRHLLTGGVLLWLLGMAIGANQRFVPETFHLPGRRMLTLATVCIGLGTFCTVAILLAAAMKQGQDQIPLLRWLIAGTLPVLAGWLAAGMVLWRSIRLLK